MFLGVGRLADIVGIYSEHRDHIFAHNVRYFIKSTKNTERGPAARIRDTLHKVVVEKTTAPELFAFYHNGITISVSKLEPAENGIKIANPYILNGCQTVKSAFLYSEDPKWKTHIDRERWDAISIPVRIVSSTDEELLRQVTVANNRQNAISAQALRATDRIQVELETQFKQSGILYERQEGALTHILETDPSLLEEHFENSAGKAVRITDLARMLAAAGGEFHLAESPAHIFESDANYNKVFSQNRRKSIVFLTFLQNLYDVSALAVKDLGIERQAGAPSNKRVAIYAATLLLRYFEKVDDVEFICEYGDRLWGNKNTEFRFDIVKAMGNYHSKIKECLEEYFFSLSNAKGKDLKQAYETAAKRYASKNKIFDMVANLEHEYA